MRISNFKTQTTFGSKNVPIESYKINTRNGELTVSELKDINTLSDKEQQNLSEFFMDNFIEGSENPYIKNLSKKTQKCTYNGSVGCITEHLKNLFAKDDGNNTVLLAKDTNGKVQAGIVTHSFVDEIPTLNDPKTFYLDYIVVNKEYRKNGIASNLINKTLETAKGFNDALLAGYNHAVPLYEKLGFEVQNFCLKAETYGEQVRQSVISEFQNNIHDIPKYTQLMIKPLKNSGSRWWDRMFDTLAKFRFNF
ncbi:GNAT family N-acetyltransferase [bacterium]|nr:GNAT family N-acetyltransferase [bacterium]